MKKLHWSQTPEGRKRLKSSMKKMWARKREASEIPPVAEIAADVVETVVPKSNGEIRLVIQGKDARLALSELLNSAHHNNLDVAITVRIK